MADIFHLAQIKTSNATAVYDAITTQEGLGNWWTTAVQAKPEVSSVAVFRFSPDYAREMKILNLRKDKKVEWECIAGDKEWLGTKIIFNLEQKNKNTILRFSHLNWKHQTDLFGICNYHWGLYLKSLKTYIETGKGTPHTPTLE